jgi:recombination protein RecR
MFTPLVQQLIDHLRCLAGVGPKSAQRIAFQLLERNRPMGLTLANTLQQALTLVGHCQRCQTYTEQPLCNLCSNSSRISTQLCVVETPADVFALEQTRSYNGLYFVLMGRLSPLDGIGPEEIHIPALKKRVLEDNIQELILATNPTVEGEATAHYIANLLQGTSIRCSRIAYGVPLDGELGYLDAGTLSRALTLRTTIEIK